MPTGNRLTITRAVLGAVVLIGEERGGVDMLITLITEAGSLHDRGTSEYGSTAREPGGVPAREAHERLSGAEGQPRSLPCNLDCSASFLGGAPACEDDELDGN